MLLCNSKKLLVALYLTKLALEYLQPIQHYTDTQLHIKRTQMPLNAMKSISLPSKATTTLSILLKFIDEVQKSHDMF